MHRSLHPSKKYTWATLGLVLAVILALIAVFSPGAKASRATATTAQAKPTIVLVHGAWANTASWDGVIARLQTEGYTVYAPPNPLRSLQGDAETIADFLKTISGPIVLVGHSYGGAVITNAANDVPNVKALVYVDAFAPAQGESAFELTAKFPGSVLNSAPPSQAFRSVSYPGAPKGDALLYVNPSFFIKGFANDLSAKGRGRHPEPSHAQRRHGAVRTSCLGAHPELGRRGHDRPGDSRGGSAVHGRAGPCAHHRGAGGPSIDGLPARRGGEGHHRGRSIRRQHRRPTVAPTVSLAGRTSGSCRPPGALRNQITDSEDSLVRTSRRVVYPDSHLTTRPHPL